MLEFWPLIRVFTEEEVRELCKKYQMGFEQVRRWYDGYVFGKLPYL